MQQVKRSALGSCTQWDRALTTFFRGTAAPFALFHVDTMRPISAQPSGTTTVTTFRRYSWYGLIANTGTRGLRRLTPGYGRPSQFLRMSEGSGSRGLS
jgi:hypothetical protein